MRRRTPPRDGFGDLNPHVVDLLIEGWGGSAHEHPGCDEFEPFDLSEAQIEALRDRHRTALQAEARRRGVVPVWERD